MLDWYITHVYVLPWWAYAVPLYFLVGLFAYRVENLRQPRTKSGALIWGWPIVLGILCLFGAGWCVGWLLGFTDTPPLSLSKEGGYIE